MARLSNYTASVEIQSGMKPKNNQNFPLMEAHDIVVAEDGTRLDAKLTEIISLVGESGTLTTEQNSALVAKYPQVMVKLNDVYTLLPVAKVKNTYYFQMVDIGEDEQGKYAGTMYVNINSTTGAWQFGEKYNDIPTGNGLPEVTSADAGEVLTVSNQGEWQAQPLPVYDGETEGGTSGSESGSGGYILELGAQSLAVETSGSITQEEYESLVSNYPNCQVTLQYGNTIYTFVANVLSTDNTILYFENPQADRTLIFTSMSGSYNWEVWESLIATTNTTQTIDGDKTFTGTVDFTNANVTGLSSGSSSGGVTKTKVTLAQLKAMCTAENVGAFVEIVPISVTAFNTIGNTLISTIADLTILGYEGAYGVVARDTGRGTSTTVFKITGVDIIISVFIYAFTRNWVFENGTFSNTTTQIDDIITDANFDFYIYK